MTAPNDKGAPARAESGHSATPPRRPVAPGPQLSQTALAPAFRRALAGVPLQDAGAATQPPKGTKGLAAQAGNDKSGAAQRHGPRNITTGPRAGHK